MIIYCDRLCFRTCALVIRLCWRELLSQSESINVQILDSLPHHGFTSLLRFIMQCLGFHVEEAEFFAGHLRTRDGQAVYLAAGNMSNDLAFRAAERILTQSRFLTQLNRKWGRNTIFKHISSSLKMSAVKISQHLTVADALGYVAEDKKLGLIIQRRIAFDQDLVSALSPSIKLYFYRSWSNKSLKEIRASAMLLLFFVKLREIKWIIEALIKGKADVQELPNPSEPSIPSLLVLQEDDLSFDRSYRTQPHWLFPKDGKPHFQTIVLQTRSEDRQVLDNKDLREQGVVFLSKKEKFLLSWKFWSTHPIRQRLRLDFLKCIFTSIFGSSVETVLLFDVAWLLYNANALAAICERNNVKAFMTCENYMGEASAMQLIASALNITTLSYQYSNMGKLGPLMLTTSDIMITFSPLFHQRWVQSRIQPETFIDMGYVYDTSFDYVRVRACDHRRRLADAGAQFIICYFDESVQTDKYGLISREDHCAEILALLKLVCDDPCIGLVIKTQFKWNSPQNFKEIASVQTKARATGRYIELLSGTLRNIVFPSEAALSSDIVISHIVGATAALEAAMTETRCILLNPYVMKGANDTLYEKADIVYPSLPAALKAIYSFRNGEKEHRNLGNWSSIIDHFDPFRDGQAGHRLRKLLDQLVFKANS